MASDALPDTVEVIANVAMIEFTSPSHQLHRLLQQAAQHIASARWEVIAITYHRTSEATVVRYFVYADKHEL